MGGDAGPRCLPRLVCERWGGVAVAVTQRRLAVAVCQWPSVRASLYRHVVPCGGRSVAFRSGPDGRFGRRSIPPPFSLGFCLPLSSSRSFSLSVSLSLSLSRTLFPVSSKFVKCPGFLFRPSLCYWWKCDMSLVLLACWRLMMGWRQGGRGGRRGGGRRERGLRGANRRRGGQRVA